MIFISPQAVTRYESLAASHPKRYRFRVIVTAFFGDAVLTFLQLFPLLILLGVPMLFYSHPWFHAAAALLLLLRIWFLRPTWQVTGRELTRDEAPQLFAALDSTREKLNVTAPLRVMVDSAFNASAGEVRGIFGLLGSTRVLTLGLPLLATLSHAEIMAVVAHELGHFSRRHGRFGHWLYRARAGWLAYANADETNSGVLDKTIRWYGEQFVPHFSALSFVHSRNCEFEADADAASVVGAATVGEALCRTAVLGKFWLEARHNVIARMRRESVLAPADFYERITAAVADWEKSQGDAAARESQRARANYTDTHPDLSQRLAALGVSSSASGFASAPDSRDFSPGGPALLGASWVSVLAEFNTQYQTEWGTLWRADYHYAQHVLAGAADARIETKLAVLRAGAEIDPVKAEREAAALFAAAPEHAGVAYHWWTTQLEKRNPDAPAALEALWVAAPIYRKKIGLQLLIEADQAGEIARAETWLKKLTLNNTSRANASHAVITRVEAGNAAPQALDDALNHYLTATMPAERALVAAWLFRETVPLIASREGEANLLAVNLLYLELDPEALAAAKQDEDALGDIYGLVLRKALTPADEILVQTFFSTEEILPELKNVAPIFTRKGR